MTALGMQAAGLRRSFHLSMVPVTGTLEVYLDPDGEDGDEEEILLEEDPDFQSEYAYVYTRVSNSVDFSFDTMPPESARLRVVYKVAEDA